MGIVSVSQLGKLAFLPLNYARSGAVNIGHRNTLPGAPSNDQRASACAGAVALLFRYP